MKKASKVNQLTDTEVFGVSLEKRVFLLFVGLAGTKRCGGGFLAGALFGLGRLVIER